MTTIFQELSDIGIIPVVQIERAQDAVPLAKALTEGGLPCAEITFRTNAAEESIRRIRQEVPEMLVGAGTVLTPQQAEAASNAGAQFIVSPGLNPKVVRFCQEKGVPMIPGCSNPSDIEAALELGLDTVKFFPAEQAGGIRYIKAVSAPYRQVRFMPTGGINEKNCNDYLDFDRVLACGGSWMVKPELIQAQNFQEISRLCRQAVQTMLGFSLAHVGINGGQPEEAKKIANAFSMLFGLPVREGEKSLFAGDAVEVMKQPFRGEKGHIAIGTRHIQRAVAYLERMGVEFDHSSKQIDSKGNYPAIYMKEQLGGFAVHLLQKQG